MYYVLSLIYLSVGDGLQMASVLPPGRKCQ